MLMLPRRLGWRSSLFSSTCVRRHMASEPGNQTDTLGSIIDQINELDNAGRARLALHLEAFSKSGPSPQTNEAERNDEIDSEYIEEMWKLHANEDALSKHGFKKLIGSSRYRQTFASSGIDGSRSAPSRDSLRTLFVASALPFVAFGFLDNSIMILCGEQIDELFGARLALTTLASAGLGNLIADVTGVTAANAIESGVKRLPLRAPRLNAYQETLPSAVSMRFW